jgi:hypothetical protein
VLLTVDEHTPEAVALDSHLSIVPHASAGAA